MTFSTPGSNPVRTMSQDSQEGPDHVPSQEEEHEMMVFIDKCLNTIQAM